MDSIVFKDRLKLAMTEACINGAELAEACGTSKSSICRYLKGERIPKPTTITKMANVLQVSVFWLLGDDDATPVRSKVKIPNSLPSFYPELLNSNNSISLKNENAFIEPNKLGFERKNKDIIFYC